MKAFIRKLVICLILTLCISAVIQFLTDWKIKNKSVTGHDNLHLIKNKTYDLVFLGSSRCYTQMAPEPFEKSFGITAVNLGVDGHSELIIHYLRLQNYLSKNAPPHFAILTLDPLIWAGSLNGDFNPVHKNSFARYAFGCPDPDKSFVNYFQFNFAEQYIPLYALLRYKLLLDCYLLPNPDNRSLYGYDKHDEGWDGFSAFASDSVRTRWMNKFYFDTSASNLDAIRSRLSSIDSLCKAHKIVLICLQTPIYKEVYQKDYFSIPAKLCQDLRIPFFDENCDSINNDPGNFFNVDHMNTHGVDRMTDRLLSDSGFRRILAIHTP